MIVERLIVRILLLKNLLIILVGKLRKKLGR